MNARAGAAVLVCAAAAALAAQDVTIPSLPPRFTATIEYVAVDARVVDRNGQPVRGLSQQDFQVFEDGVPQMISTFSAVEIPAPAPSAPFRQSAGVRPDVATNIRAAAGSRTYLIVLDSMSIEGSRTLGVRRFLREFIEKSIGPDDLVAITTTGRDRAYENFTNDKPRLLAAVARMFGQSGGSPAVAASLDVTGRALAIAPDPDARSGIPTDTSPIADVTNNDTRLSQHKMAQLVQDVSAVGNARSKAIILVTEGLPFDMVSNTASLDLIGDIDRVTGLARRGNVPIYPIDPRGLTDGGEDAIQTNLIGAFNAMTPAVLSEVRRSHDRLRALADDSGGVALLDRNDLSAGLNRVVSLSSVYYAIGYYSTNTKRDGRYHRVTVQVDRPDVKVLSRHGYTAPSPSKIAKASSLPGPSNATGETRYALNATLPPDGVAMAATAAAFRQPGSRNATVAVVVEALGADLAWNDNGTLSAPIEVAAAALDAHGGIRSGANGRVSLSASTETSARVRQQGLRWLARLDNLKPGHYQIRAVVTNTPARQGSVWYDIDVPDFARAPIAMSDVLLASVVASQRLTIRPDKALAGALPAPATTLRQFLPADSLAIYAEVYDNDRQPGRDIETSLVIVNDRGEEKRREVRTLTASNGVLRLQARLPLTDLTPGWYTLAVEARQAANRAVATGRAVPIQIVDTGNR